jgi:hypothetical protein
MIVVVVPWRFIMAITITLRDLRGPFDLLMFLLYPSIQNLSTTEELNRLYYCINRYGRVP